MFHLVVLGDNINRLIHVSLEELVRVHQVVAVILREDLHFVLPLGPQMDRRGVDRRSDVGELQLRDTARDAELAPVLHHAEVLVVHGDCNVAPRDGRGGCQRPTLRCRRLRVRRERQEPAHDSRAEGADAERDRDLDRDSHRRTSRLRSSFSLVAPSDSRRVRSRSTTSFFAFPRKSSFWSLRID